MRALKDHVVFFLVCVCVWVCFVMFAVYVMVLWFKTLSVCWGLWRGHALLRRCSETKKGLRMFLGRLFEGRVPLFGFSHL